jgi:hypothetical protein
VATCRWCQGYFVVARDERDFCSQLCRQKHRQRLK